MTDLRAQLVAAGAQLSALGLSPGASGKSQRPICFDNDRHPDRSAH